MMITVREAHTDSDWEQALGLLPAVYAGEAYRH